MGKILKQRIKQKRFESAAQEVILNALVTADYLVQKLNDVCEQHGISHSQYNVLRILRGVHPHGYPRYEIADRMLERSPDVTRLLDRLTRMKLVVRGRSADDSRLSIATITVKGLDLLERMAPAVQSLHRHVEQRLTAAERREFSKLCEKLYGQQQIP
ncbi:MAG: MarR family transcriptional regulator [candidate division Zixibacteria bacterium]|jgi:DNA-binding MarR family transcriptional regulator|nr:MarR family transcriptional regulator [candidate division Zixibacteria bacterium]